MENKKCNMRQQKIVINLCSITFASNFTKMCRFFTLIYFSCHQAISIAEMAWWITSKRIYNVDGNIDFTKTYSVLLLFIFLFVKQLKWLKHQDDLLLVLMKE